jgi:N-acyl-D-aspartate/D-glutamate deacylase
MPTWQLLIRGGQVVDGTGLPAFTADVGIRDGRIEGIGRLAGNAERVLEADGLIVCPGFIDVHTHYDVQVEWDPILTPSCWHGFTSVVAGNCGFTIAPASEDDVRWLAAMLSRVEGMSPDAIAAGLGWKGGSFEAFWSRLEGRLGLNVGSLVGHAAVRRQVMGDAASDGRRASETEIAAMRALVAEAMQEGALGLSTSQLAIHVDHEGREVPCNHATAEEILALAAAVGDHGRGIIEMIPRSVVEGFDTNDRSLLREMSRCSGRPIALPTLVPGVPGWRECLEFARDSVRDGYRMHPMFATNLFGQHLSLESTFLLDEIPSFRAALSLAGDERRRALADPEVRERMRSDLANGQTMMQLVWSDLQIERVDSAEFADWQGRSVSELAASRDADPLDCFLDVALADDLRASFYLDFPPGGSPRKDVAELLRDPIVLAGSSDGGAHLQSFTGADYSTRLLSDWVPDVLSLEEAIHKLTLAPATAVGFTHRGALQPGWAADVLVLEADRLTPGPAELLTDFPGGSSRFASRADGYHYTVVNGQVLIEKGEHTGSMPGRFLRP